MQIHPLLAFIVKGLLEGLGETAGIDGGNVDAWTNRDVLDFIDRTRRMAGDEYMGLATDQCGPGAADFAMELGARCSTLREAIDCNCRFLAIATRAFTFTLEEDEERGLAILAVIRNGGATPASAALSDWIMIAWHKLMQWLIGAEITLKQTEFDHPLTTEYRFYGSMFGGSCQFNQPACRLVFDRNFLDRKVIRQAWEAHRLKATTPGYFEKPGLVARSWNQKVRDVMRVEVAAGNPVPTTEDLAEEFGISSKTLQRRLRDEGASVRQIKAEVRVEAARNLLSGEGATVGEASIAAGFSEPNALARALRSTRGMTTDQLRDEVKSWRGGDKR